MKLKKLLLRYYPPGIILQYEKDGVIKQKPIDLLDLTPDADIEVCSLWLRPLPQQAAQC
jgi:dynein assembly factor with WDR repeat domains 1